MAPEDVSPSPKTALEVRTYENRYVALGLAVEYLMKKPAFARLPFGHWSRILTGQIRRGHYFFVFQAKQLVGFAGWALASGEEADAWVSGSGDVAQVEGTTGDTMVLNAWAADAPGVNQFIHDHLRNLLAGRGLVGLYAKREYPDGSTRVIKLHKDDMIEGRGLKRLMEAG